MKSARTAVSWKLIGPNSSYFLLIVFFAACPCDSEPSGLESEIAGLFFESIKRTTPIQTSHPEVEVESSDLTVQSIPSLGLSITAGNTHHEFVFENGSSSHLFTK